MAAASAFRPGATVAGKYRLRRRLAAGATGEIWVARNEATRAKVALKVLRAGTTATQDSIERFRQEARIGGMLAHRNIVRVFDLIDEGDGTLVLVMELLPGEPLAVYLRRRGPLSPREAVGLCLPILAALRHAHEQEILHRDISPRNVFLVVEPDGHIMPKLVDFGLAKAPNWAFETVEGSILGTPSYMSPEQIRAEANLDGRTDIYGVAAVLYEMMTGSPPYVGKTPMATLAAALDGDEPDHRAIDPRLWAVLRKALAKKREDRPEDAQAFAEQLVAALGTTVDAVSADLRTLSAVVVTDDIQTELSPDGDSRDSRDLRAGAGRSSHSRRAGMSSHAPTRTGRPAFLVLLLGASVVALAAAAGITVLVRMARPSAAARSPSPSVSGDVQR